MPDDLRPPWRIQFDNARDPYTARNVLGIMGAGGGFITSVSSPLSVTGGNLTIDLSGYQPLDADLTAIAALTGTNTIYYRSAADTWSAVTVGTGLSFAGGTLANTVSAGGNVSNSGTPAAGEIAEWVTATTIKGVSTYAKLASPALTGNPTAPTPAAGDNDTSIATTAFVQAVAAAMFSTGDAKLTLKMFADPGWVMMDDGTIGNASSGATTRANADCEALFTLLWNNTYDTYAPVSGGRGASAAADWAANKQLTLTRQMGRSISIAGAGAGLSTIGLGYYDGTEAHAQTVGEMAFHSHTPPAPGASLNTDGSTGLANTGSIYYLTTAHNAWSATGDTGSGVPASIISPRSFWNIMLKL